MSPKQAAKRRRSCEGKKRYRTAVEAGREAEAIYQRYGSWQRLYYCHFCGGGYHLTSR